METLQSLTLRGFKSIKRLDNLTFGPLNILVGANGAGKSNLISFFKMLNWMTHPPGNLQFFIGKYGGANAFLFESASITPQIEANLFFKSDLGINEYYMRLVHAAGDTLIFAEEKYRFSRFDFKSQAPWEILDSGHKEAMIIKKAELWDRTAKTILTMLKRLVFYQFHNTSDTARIRQRWPFVDDNRLLKEDGANLAAFLYRLQQTKPTYYHRIVETVREIAPFFADFELVPDNGSILLQWRERESDVIFGPHQASDGTLRMFALVSLLLQPEEELPSAIILDEPELGLHPYAINVVAGLIKSVSISTQVILATQSMNFIDYFKPDDIIVVDRPKRESFFRRLDLITLKEWLDEYSLAELWEKNVIGGRP